MTLKCLKPKEPDCEPRTLGEHLKLRRLQRKLSQTQAAQALQVNPSTILNWEKGHTEPPVEAMPPWTVLNWEKGHTEPPLESLPVLLRFLDYDPFPEPKTLPERLLAKRRTMGWSIREAAQQLGVDPGTWRNWEQGRVILFRRYRDLVARHLGLPATEIDQEMRARSNRSHKRNLGTEPT